jgi:hypothetical protein
MKTLGLLLLLAGGGAFSIPAQDSSAEGRPIPIQNSDPQFRMTVPAGYRAAEGRPGTSAYAFQRIDGKPIAITVEILKGRIDPGDLNEAEMEAARKQLPAGAKFRVSKESWGPHQIDVMESRFTAQGVEAFALGVQFPILPRAVQVTIGGQQSFEAQMRDDLRQILRTFHGTTHWLTPSQRSWAGSSGGCAILSWLLLIIYGITYAIRWRGGDVVSQWRFRVIYLTGTVAMFSLSIVAGVVYNSLMHRETMDASIYVLGGVALACAVKTGDLYKKGLELRQKAAAGTPPPS